MIAPCFSIYPVFVRHFFIYFSFIRAVFDVDRDASVVFRVQEDFRTTPSPFLELQFLKSLHKIVSKRSSVRRLLLDRLPADGR
jgi:hypothetical protein